MRDLKIFKNSKVIVTGHTGFKGSWLTAWLKQLNANVMGISLNVPTSPSHFKVSKIGNGIKNVKLDICNRKKLQQKIIKFKPDFLFHLAAQSLVRISYKDPVSTWHTNLIGTMNVLEALKKIDKKCCAIIITSDKCYFNKEVRYGYKETDLLGGKDPYSGSKASAEILIKSYISSFFKKNSKVRIVTARAGNVIGGGDWSNGRIVPDIIKSWSNKKKIELRNSKATRPWQHVLEAVGGYLCLAINLKNKKNLHGESFNFGPGLTKEYSVEKLVKEMRKYLKNVSYKKISKSKRKFFESELLRLNCNKAKKKLGWKSVLKFNETIEMVAKWYFQYFLNKKNAELNTRNLINSYQALAKNRGLKWSKVS